LNLLNAAPVSSNTASTGTDSSGALKHVSNSGLVILNAIWFDDPPNSI